MLEEAHASTVLVIDDNAANRALAQSTLDDEGYRVVLAAGGAEGIAAFEAQRPDCILLDVRMPGVDGFAACERIRELPGGAETPIIFLTAQRDIETFDRALRAGGDDFLTKPVLPTELVVRVQAALKLGRLGSELRQHVELLRKQRDDLMRLQLQRERLMAFVVHDLKNPVASMDLHAQFVLRDRGLPESARESVLQIRAEARQLNRMILNLLDMSKADEGKLTPKRAVVDLSAIVTDVAAELELSAQQRKIALKLALSASSVHADEDLLRRTLANLVENAIRHAPPGSSVEIASARYPGGSELRVSDGGSGVPPEMRDGIFDAFVQMMGEGRPRSGGGRGLGLTFCKLAVQAHGGQIWVEDGAPGAVFCARFPDE
jgi:two-component system, sensor histidine kinase and response regulator